MSAVNKIGIIGGGAAGMMAAYFSKKANNSVTILEKNSKLGKKIYITGKGRCNITNMSDPQNHIENCVKNAYFLYSSMYAFTSQDVIELFNKKGLKTKVERGNRVFPISDKAADVVKTLEKMIMDIGVDVKLSKEVIKVSKLNDKFIVKTKEEEFLFDSIIIATGGRSYPNTGSDGKFLDEVKRLGHCVTKLRPTLTSFITAEDVGDMAGLTLKNVELNIKKLNLFGDLLFTHKGISGPIVLTSTALLGDDEKFPINCYIDLKPKVDFDELDKRIIREIEKSPSKNIGNMLKEILPLKLIKYIIKLSGLDAYTKSFSLTREERQKLVKNIKRFNLTLIKYTGYNDAVVTRGGVDITEIDPYTMESKIIKNLYFAGEIIDVDSLTGGYNLQIAWSTGYMAGNSNK